MMGSKVEPMGKPESERGARRWRCVGPCMMSFGIPLLIPGVTLTCVALSSNTGLEMYTGLHITGYIFLAVGLLLLCAGCICYNTFRIKVGPLPVVLVSQVDLRLSHNQRLYSNKPTFFIRTNSVKPSTCFKVENEIEHSKNNFGGTGKVATVAGQYKKRGEQANVHGSITDGVSKTLVSTSKPGNPESSDSTVTSEESTSSSESDTEDCTSSSCTSSDTSSSDSSLNSHHKPNGSVLSNKHTDDTGNSLTHGKVANIPLTLTNSKPLKANIYFSPSEHLESIDEVDSPFKWENVHLSEKHLLKRASEDVKSEELKPALMKSIAWYAKEGNTREGIEFKQQLTTHGMWPYKTHSTSVEDDSDDVDGDNVDNDNYMENDSRNYSSDSVSTSSASTIFSPSNTQDLPKTSSR